MIESMATSISDNATFLRVVVRKDFLKTIQDYRFAHRHDSASEAIIAKMPGPRIAPRYMDYEQAGQYIGGSAEAIRAYIRQGYFPVIRKNGKRWVDKEDLDRFMAKNKQ